MPTYSPTKSVTGKPRGRNGSRPLSMDWAVRKATAHGLIKRLRNEHWVNEDALDTATSLLDSLTHSRSNSEHNRTYAKVKAAICQALGLADERAVAVPSPTSAKPTIDSANPPIGLRFLIGSDVFHITGYTPGEHPRPNTLHGYWLHTPGEQVVLHPAHYGADLHTCATDYGWNLDAYLLKHHARVNNIHFEHPFPTTYSPKRTNRCGPMKYQFVAFIGLDRMHVRVDDKHLKVVTVKQWKLWRTRSGLR